MLFVENNINIERKKKSKKQIKRRVKEKHK